MSPPRRRVARRADTVVDVAGATRSSLEAEILLARLRLFANALPGGPAAGCTWGERPIAWLTDLFLTLATTTDPRWTTLLPPRLDT